MKLLFQLGNNSDLNKKEIEATAATILPSSFGTYMVSSQFLILNIESVEGGSLDIIQRYVNGARSQDAKILETINNWQNRLGGTVRIGLIMEDNIEGSSINAKIEDLIKEEGVLAGSRLDYGISYWGHNLKYRELTGRLHKNLKECHCTIREVRTLKGEYLSSAQVFHNRLTLFDRQGKPRIKGAEYMVVQYGKEYGHGNQFVLARTLTVQNMDSYSYRDFKIPKPDPVSGMLPPKLAQTMINLAFGGLGKSKQSNNITAVYDPFCGNGRLISEAELMGLKAFGSDIEQKKIEASRINTQWVRDHYSDWENLANRDSVNVALDEAIFVGDATLSETVKRFKEVYEKGGSPSLAVVSEPYLGKPLRGALTLNQKDAWVEELAGLYLKTLENWKNEQLPASNIVLVFPKAKVEGGKEASVYTKLVDRIAALGYDSTVLGCYKRPDSFVIREIVQLKIK